MLKKRPFKLKYYQKILTTLHFLADFITILLSFLFAYHTWNLIGPVLSIDMYEKVSITRYSLFFGVSLVSVLIGFEVNSLYQPQRSILNIKEFSLVFKTWLMACGVTMVVLYMADELYFSRGILIATWLIMLCFLILERYFFFKFNIFLTFLGVFETTVLLYGTGALARQLVSKFKQSPKLGYRVVGFVDDSSSEFRHIMGIPVLGNYEDLERIIKETKAQKIFITVVNLASKRVIDILNICRATGCKFQIIPSTYEMALERIKLVEVEGIPLISIQEPKIPIRSLFFKRLFDFTISLFLLLLVSPFVFLFTIAIKFTDWEPVIDRQIRFGKGAKTFDFYKLGAIHIKHKKRMVLFKNGKKMIKWLYRWNLDRFPQLWSVFRGDMSLVGPRAQSLKWSAGNADVYEHLLCVPPGITGLWDLSANKDLSHFQDSELDIYYIRNHSILMDIFIILRKLFGLLLSVPKLNRRGAFS